MKRFVLSLLGICFILSNNIYAKDCYENDYKPVSKEMLSFIDKYIGLNVFFDFKKFKNKHNLLSHNCSIDGNSLTYENYMYCKNDLTSSRYFIIHNGVYRVSHYSYSVFSIDLGMVLNGKYYYSDVKKAINKMIPNFPDNFSNHAFVVNRATRRFKYKDVYFTMDALIYGDASNKEYAFLKNTYINFEIRIETDKVQQCLQQEKLRLEKVRQIKQKGKNLILN